MDTAWAMILAAGQGTRLSEATGGMAKQFLEWQGVPLYWHSARLFGRCAGVKGLIFVFPAEKMEAERERLNKLFQQDDPGLPWRVVSGGALRQDSVRAGLAVLPEGCRRVLIHDSARPFATAGLVNRILMALEQPGTQGVIPGIPVTDTVKLIEKKQEDGRDQEIVVSTPERSGLRAVQTPQGFDVEALRAAHAEAVAQGWTVTDDASVFERTGRMVCVVEGETGNLKITSPEDLTMLRDAALPCVGYGYDVHRFADANSSESQARPMRLGGILLPGAPSVLAHSDGDVLFHALMDALLGAAGLGDIGQHFPDSDAAFENINSAVLLDSVLDKIHVAGVQITHVDLTIVTQIPKIGPHCGSIRKNVARLLQLDLSHVNLKATTEEGLGFTGERLGIKAVALVTGERR